MRARSAAELRAWVLEQMRCGAYPLWTRAGANNLREEEPLDVIRAILWLVYDDLAHDAMRWVMQATGGGIPSRADLAHRLVFAALHGSISPDLPPCPTTFDALLRGEP